MYFPMYTFRNMRAIVYVIQITEWKYDRISKSTRDVWEMPSGSHPRMAIKIKIIAGAIVHSTSISCPSKRSRFVKLLIIRVEGKSLSTPPGAVESRDKVYPSIKCQVPTAISEGGWAHRVP